MYRFPVQRGRYQLVQPDNEISFVPKLTGDGWKIFQFKKTVKARYLRVYVGRVTDFTSMNEAEIFAPAN